MTVPVQTPINSYLYAGSPTFNFTFQVLQAADLVVTVDGAVKVLGVDYTASGIGVQGGGTVVYLGALTTGQNITLRRLTALQRTTDYQNNGDLLSPTLNADFDRLWQALQEFDQIPDRAIVVPVDESVSVLPDADARADHMLAFDSTGDAGITDFTTSQVAAAIAALSPGGTGGTIVAREKQTASAGQTVFNLASITYTPGVNALFVSVDGAIFPQSDYTETSTSRVTFAAAFNGSEQVEFIVARLVTSGVPSTQISLQRTGGIASSLDFWFNHAVPTFFDYLTAAEIGDAQSGALTIDFAPKLNAFMATKGAKLIPPGIYRLNSTVSWSGSGVRLIGYGVEITKFVSYVTNDDVLRIGDGTTNPNACGARSFGVFVAAAAASGAVLRCRNAHGTEFADFRIDGTPYRGVQVDGGSGQYITHIRDYEINAGTQGIVLGADGTFPQETFIHPGVIASVTDAAVLLLHCGGVYMERISTINCNHGLVTYPGVAQIVQAVYARLFLADTTTSHGISILTNGGQATDVTLTDCWAASCGQVGSGNGILIEQGIGVVRGVSINAPRISACGGSGLYLGGSLDVDIINPSTGNNSLTTPGTKHGIEVKAGVSQWSVLGGTCGLVGYYPSNAQAYGIYVTAGASDYYSILGVNLTGNTTGPLLDSGTGANKDIAKNPGFNPRPIQSLAAGTSPTSFGNTSGDASVLIVNGGTVSSIVVDGFQVAAATNTSVVVPQGGFAQITWSSAPTINFRGV